MAERSHPCCRGERVCQRPRRSCFRTRLNVHNTGESQHKTTSFSNEPHRAQVESKRHACAAQVIAGRGTVSIYSMQTLRRATHFPNRVGIPTSSTASVKTAKPSTGSKRALHLTEEGQHRAKGSLSVLTS